MEITEADCELGAGVPVPQGGTIYLSANFTATVASGTIYSQPHQHPGGTAGGATGTGFYCGRRYEWSEFPPDESRPLFAAASRRSLLGWVWADAGGQQVAACAGHPPIFRPPGQ